MELVIREYSDRKDLIDYWVAMTLEKKEDDATYAWETIYTSQYIMKKPINTHLATTVTLNLWETMKMCRRTLQRL
jgi:hypothetical protein